MIHYSDPSLIIYHGDCLEILANRPDNSVDAIVTDPPYGLGFMGKDWDALPPGLDWARECLRVLKPGGHIIAFGGSRTWHRLAAAVEDAGFEIRDSIAWLYGSGFPKSLDVSKAIDKAGGISPEIQSATLRTARERSGLTRESVAEAIDCTPSSVRDWEEGRARATGKAIEFITPSPEYRAKLAHLLGYTDDERSVVGLKVDRRGDGTVVGLGHSGVEYGHAATDAAKRWAGWGTALKPAFEPIVVGRKPLMGTVAANVLAHGTGALNIDACRIGNSGGGNACAGGDLCKCVTSGVSFSPTKHAARREGEFGRWPANVILDEAMAEVLDEQSGTARASGVYKGSGKRTTEGAAITDFGNDTGRPGTMYSDSGGASRFFYVAKAPTKERPKVDGIAHPTVKPLALMRWLVRLVTPPGGIVLDPFLGSGTTAEACRLEGFRCIGIERDETYLPLIAARLNLDGEADAA